ncbi:MAG: glycosyltransferase N-terminal domain-containing protein, partial [Endomicrobiia bacterium]
MVIIYNILLTFFIILFAPIIFTRYKFNKINKSYRIWIHCASLGEAKIALKLIKYLVDKFNFAVDNILLTTTTKTAKMFAKKEHNETYIFPIDYFLITRKLIKKIKPKVLIIVETEL